MSYNFLSLNLGLFWFLLWEQYVFIYFPFSYVKRESPGSGGGPAVCLSTAGGKHRRGFVNFINSHVVLK